MFARVLFYIQLAEILNNTFEQPLVLPTSGLNGALYECGVERAPGAKLFYVDPQTEFLDISSVSGVRSRDLSAEDVSNPVCIATNGRETLVAMRGGKFVWVSKNGIAEAIACLDTSHIVGAVTAMALTNSVICVGTEKGSLCIFENTRDTYPFQRSYSLTNRQVVQIVPYYAGYFMLDGIGNVFRITKNGTTLVQASESILEHTTETEATAPQCLLSQAMVIDTITVPQACLGDQYVHEIQNSFFTGEQVTGMVKFKNSISDIKNKSKDRMSKVASWTKGLMKLKDKSPPPEVKQHTETESTLQGIVLLLVASPVNIKVFAIPKTELNEPQLLYIINIPANNRYNTSKDVPPCSCQFRKNNRKTVFALVKNIEILHTFGESITLVSMNVIKDKMNVEKEMHLTLSKIFQGSINHEAFKQLNLEAKSQVIKNGLWLNEKYVCLLTSEGILLSFLVDEQKDEGLEAKETSPVTSVRRVMFKLVPPIAENMPNLLASTVYTHNYLSNLPNGGIFLLCEKQENEHVLMNVIPCRILSIFEQIDFFTSRKMILIALQTIADQINVIKKKDLKGYIAEYFDKAKLCLNELFGKINALCECGMKDEIENTLKQSIQARYRVVATLVVVFTGAFSIESKIVLPQADSLVNRILNYCVDQKIITFGETQNPYPSLLNELLLSTIVTLILTGNLSFLPYSFMEHLLSNEAVISLIPAKVINKVMDNYRIASQNTTDSTKMQSTYRRTIILSMLLSCGVQYPYEKEVYKFALKNNLIPFIMCNAATPIECPMNPNSKMAHRLAKMHGVQLLPLETAMEKANTSAMLMAENVLNQCRDILQTCYEKQCENPTTLNSSSTTDVDFICDFLVAQLSGFSLIPKQRMCLLDPNVRHISSIPQVSRFLPVSQVEAFRFAFIDLMPSNDSEFLNDQYIHKIRLFFLLASLRPNAMASIFRGLISKLLEPSFVDKRELYAQYLERTTNFVLNGLIGNGPVKNIIPWQSCYTTTPLSDIHKYVNHKIAYHLAKMFVDVCVNNKRLIHQLSSYQALLILLSAVSEIRFVGVRNETISLTDLLFDTRSIEDIKSAQRVKQARLLYAALVEARIIKFSKTGVFSLLARGLSSLTTFPTSFRAINYAKLLSILNEEKYDINSRLLCSTLIDKGHWFMLFTMMLPQMGVSQKQAWLAFMRFVSLLSGGVCVGDISLKGMNHTSQEVSIEYVPSSNSNTINYTVSNVTVSFGLSEDIFEMYGIKTIAALHAIYIEFARSREILSLVPPLSFVLTGLALFSNWPGRLLSILRCSPNHLVLAADILLFADQSKAQMHEIDNVAIRALLKKIVGEFHSSDKQRAASSALSDIMVALFDPFVGGLVYRRAERKGLHVVRIGFRDISLGAYTDKIRKVSLDWLSNMSDSAKNLKAICCPDATVSKTICSMLLENLLYKDRLGDAETLISDIDFITELDSENITVQIQHFCMAYSGDDEQMMLKRRNSNILLARVFETQNNFPSAFNNLLHVLGTDIKTYDAKQTANMEEGDSQPIANNPHFVHVYNDIERICRFLAKLSKKANNGTKFIMDCWKEFLSCIATMQHVRTRTHLTCGIITEQIQTSLYPREAMECFMAGFSNLKWSEMRSELLGFLSGVRTNVILSSIITKMSSAEHSDVFRATLEAQSQGISCNDTNCYFCGRPLLSAERDTSEPIVAFGCGHVYHQECAPDECDCK